MIKKETLLVANVESNSVTLIDKSNLNNKIDLPVGINPHEVAVSPNNAFALVSNYGSLSGRYPGHTLTSIDIKNNKVIETINLPDKSRPHGIHFISDDYVLVTAQGLNKIVVLKFDENFKKAAVANTINLNCDGAHMIVADHGNEYAYVGCFSGNVCKINITDLLSTEIPVSALKAGNKIAGLALSANGKTLFAANMSISDSFVAVIDTENMEIIKKIKTKLGPSRVQLFNEGKSLLIIDSVAGKAEIMDVHSLCIVKSINTTNSFSHKNGRYCGGLFGLLPVPVNAVINEDQTAYFTNLYAGNVAKVDLNDGEILNTFESGVSPDGISSSTIMYTGCNKM